MSQTDNKKDEGKHVPPNSLTTVEKTLVTKDDNDNKTDTVKDFGQYISAITGISNNIATKLRNNNSVLELFPDISLATMILVSTIASPKDMLTDSITLSYKGNLIPANIASVLNTEIKNYMGKTYRLEENLYTVVEKALITEGAYAEIFIPTGNIEAMADFDGDLESYVDSVTDASKDDAIIQITDNIELLCAKDKVEVYADTESLQTLSDIKGDKKALFKKLKNITRPSVVIEDFQDTSLLRKVVPATSIIPLASKDNPSKHHGYFVLLDETGSFINMKKQKAPKTFLEMGSQERSAAVTQALATKQTMQDNSNTMLNAEEMIDKLITDTITANFDSSNKTLLTDFEFTQSVFDVMFKRIVSKQKTRLLFIPQHLVAYFAFDYRNDGTGKSLLEKLAPLASLRATMLMTRVNAAIENSITKVKVELQLDDKDQNPDKTAEMVRGELVKAKMGSNIVGMLDMDDISEHIHNAGIYMEVKHESLPDMSLNFNDITSDKKVPDTDLYDGLKEDTAKVFGLSPELVEKGYDSDFAISAAMNSALFARRVLMYKSKLDPNITKYYKIIARFDVNLKTILLNTISSNLQDLKKTLNDELLKTVKEDKVSDDDLTEFLYMEYLDDFYGSSSKVVLEEDNGLAKAYQAYKTEVEDYIETYISEDSLPEELFSDFNGNIDYVKTAIQHTLLRKWMTDNNYLTDLSQLFTTDDSGNVSIDVLGEYNAYINNLTSALEKFTKQNNKQKKKAAKKLAPKEDEDEEVVEDTKTEDNVTEDSVTEDDDIPE